MKKWMLKCISPVLVLVIALTCIITAAPVAADANSITINPSTIIDSLNSGATKTYTFSVTNGFALTVEVDGLGEGTDGAPYAVSPANDTSAFSCRSWVTIDKNQIAVGSNQTLNVTITVPANTPAGEKYAAVYLYSLPSNQGSASVISGVIVPVIITVNAPSFTQSIAGQMTGLSVPHPYTGAGLDIITDFSDTGNCRITGATDNVTIKDSSGNIKWQNQSPVGGSSVLPGYPRIIDTKYNVGLAKGNYSVESDIVINNGSTLATQTISFTVADPPPVPSAPGLVAPGKSTSPGSTVNTLNPAFQWNAVSAADYYTLTISRTPYSADNLVYTSGQLTGTSFPCPDGVLFNGQTYCWRLTATNYSGTGPSSNTFYFQTPGAYTAPTVATGIADNITNTTATLHATLSDLGSAVTVNVNFEYGTDTGYGNLTDVQTLSAAGAFEANIIGLIPDTTYHFQANAGGLSTVYGDDVTFTTLPAAVTTTDNNSTTTTATSGTIDFSKYLLPGMIPSSLVGLSFDNVAVPYLDATQTTDIEVTLNGVSGSGAIIVGKYSYEPSDDVGFSEGQIKGGTGKLAIEFLDVRLLDYNFGTARATVHFTSAEIKNFDANTLFLAYYSSNKWHNCGNIAVSVTAGTISGDIPISDLNGTILGLGGTSLNTSGAAFAPPGNNNGGSGVPWGVVALVVIPILIVGGVIFVIERNRKKTQTDKNS